MQSILGKAVHYIASELTVITEQQLIANCKS